VHKGNQQPGENLNTKKDGKEIFFYLPSKFNKDWAGEVQTGDDGQKKELAKFLEFIF
jgi:hypothetical protein